MSVKEIYQKIKKQEQLTSNDYNTLLFAAVTTNIFKSYNREKLKSEILKAFRFYILNCPRKERKTLVAFINKYTDLRKPGREILFD